MHYSPFFDSCHRVRSFAQAPLHTYHFIRLAVIPRSPTLPFSHMSARQNYRETRRKEIRKKSRDKSASISSGRFSPDIAVRGEYQPRNATWYLSDGGCSDVQGAAERY
jgi:hypothetical protein